MQIYLYDYYSNYIENNYTAIDLTKQQELENLIHKSIRDNDNICLNLDGGYGYTINFIELICNFLIEKFNNKIILSTITIVSNDEPALQKYVMKLLNRKN